MISHTEQNSSAWITMHLLPHSLLAVHKSNMPTPFFPKTRKIVVCIICKEKESLRVWKFGGRRGCSKSSTFPLSTQPDFQTHGEPHSPTAVHQDFTQGWSAAPAPLSQSRPHPATQPPGLSPCAQPPHQETSTSGTYLYSMVRFFSFLRPSKKRMYVIYEQIWYKYLMRPQIEQFTSILSST